MRTVLAMGYGHARVVANSIAIQALTTTYERTSEQTPAKAHASMTKAFKENGSFLSETAAGARFVGGRGRFFTGREGQIHADTNLLQGSSASLALWKVRWHEHVLPVSFSN